MARWARGHWSPERRLLARSRLEHYGMTTNLSPPETEIRWELADPADRQLTFIYDRLSTPNPTCPLAQSMAPLVEEQVILQSTRELDIPIADYQVRYCND